MSVNFPEVIDDAFRQYQPTVELLNNLQARKVNPQEFVILVCARLDSLSNLAFLEGTQKSKFIKFLMTFSQHGNAFQKVSVPDLYYFLTKRLLILPGTIPQAGRVHVYHPTEEKEFISFIWKSGVSITEDDIEKVLVFLLKVLKKKYRIAPNQSLRKLTADSPKSVLKCILEASNTYRKGMYDEAARAIVPVIHNFTLGGLLYSEYRCASIHKHEVNMYEIPFFKEKGPHWCSFYDENCEPSHFLKVHFPGPFLFDTLVKCIGNYKKYLRKIKKLPADLFFQFCDVMTDLDYLDEETIPMGKAAKISA